MKIRIGTKGDDDGHTENTDCNGNGYEDIEDWLNEKAGDGIQFAAEDAGPMCPNGIVEEGEQCDDNNAVNTDACVACMNAFCGDTFVHTGIEQCDQANTSSQDACLTTCSNAGCGDNWVCDEAGCTTGPASGVEQCDDGDSIADDGCQADCSRTSNAPGASIITNGSFASAGPATCNASANDWVCFTDGAGTVTNSGGRWGYTVTTSGSNVQLYQTGRTITMNTCYRLQFDARITNQDQAGGSNDLAVNMFDHTTIEGFGLSKTYDLGLTSRTYTSYFTTPTSFVNGSSSASNGRLQFTWAPYDDIGEVYLFDAIEIRPITPVCGNGILENVGFGETFCGAETCDDGNVTNGDGCSSLCLVETGPTKKRFGSSLSGGTDG
jgi:cysteine-rich repeat protein